MSDLTTRIDEISINTIRFLSVDAVQKANSGHPGMPMGCAPIAYSIYYNHLKHNPKNPKWINRDRFILSAGHGSMLLYSTLHLCGYDITMDDLKNFRQWESITPGHPEAGMTPGVEVTSGPLGQGFANSVGMAIASLHLAGMFNKENFKLIDHYIYGICSDGDLMEGISHEAASIAGHLKLGNIIFFYDDNGITIDGSTSISCSDDVKKRFEAYNWDVQIIEDGNDLDAINRCILHAKEVTDKPSLIVTKTHIGFGSPNKQDSSESHGAPLGKEEVRLTKENLKWNYEEFSVPDEVKSHFKLIPEKGNLAEQEWNNLFEEYKKQYPEDAEKFESFFKGKYADNWYERLPQFEDAGKPIATRVASGKVLNYLAENIPGLFGGSADLAGSNNTFLEKFGGFSADNRAGRNIHFGIREHSMAAILNGISLYAPFIPYGATFLIFSDYLRPSIRLAAISRVRPVYIFTHDSIGLGEDGPTHQPVEQLASLRVIPNLTVIRPADANETVYAWAEAIRTQESPVALVLTRQGLPILDRNKYAPARFVEKGAYILKDSDETPDVILMASGSEVFITLQAAEKLEAEGIKARVVSFPSWELFEKQSIEYKESVLPSSVLARVSVEAAAKQGWEKYTGDLGSSISVETFGASAPDKVLFEKYGFTVDNIVNTAKQTIDNLLF